MKKVIVLNQSTGLTFGIGGRDVSVSETMNVADAEFIKAQYPGVYVDVIDEPEAATGEGKVKGSKSA
ncbi:hypothetical protein [Spirosoma litoris]